MKFKPLFIIFERMFSHSNMGKVTYTKAIAFDCQSKDHGFESRILH
ncbi:hypothetical protein [Chryseobacterium sp. JV274]|nr:hypothetical protein [Chryseobacterium sp. JV274]CAD0220117.1 protein of unknown function [Chryseobacterium sp. JV274]